MSTITELNPRLEALTEAGVSVWLDQIRRSMVEGGELARMVAVESLRGVTSNPAIFEKAILGSTDYDEDLRTLARENLDSTAIYERIAIRDVQLGDLETLRAHGLAAERVEAEGDPAQAVRALTERITAILQET
jgi:transaldolase